jgi:7-cyano-7-deazaguanine synthase
MVVLGLSGGLDSAVLLAALQNNGEQVLPVFFNYGAKNSKYEHSAVLTLIAHYGLKGKAMLVQMTPIMSHFKSSLLMHGDTLPEGHYDNEEMKTTIVPARNLIFISVLAGIAESHGCERVAVGIHAGEAGESMYPDSRPGFLTAANDVVLAATDNKVQVEAPFVVMSKLDVLQVGQRLNVPFKFTRTCYADQVVACGKCGACQKRLFSFSKLGMADPLEYETRELLT